MGRAVVRLSMLLSASGVVLVCAKDNLAIAAFGMATALLLVEES